MASVQELVDVFKAILKIKLIKMRVMITMRLVGSGVGVNWW